MKSVALVLLILTFLGVGAYALNQKRLLPRETFVLILEALPRAAMTEAVAEPIGGAASVEDKQQEMRDETQKMKELANRLESERKEIEGEKAMLEERLRALEQRKAEASLKSERARLESKSPSSTPDEELTKLVKIYEGMPPEEAASILENLPDSTVAQILLQMRERNASLIMGEMSTNKSVAVSQLLIPERIRAASCLAGLKGNVTVMKEKEGIRITIQSPILFDSGKSLLRPDAELVLNELIKILKDNPNSVIVEGHTDNIPINTPEFHSNWELSTARAISVVRYFVEKGNLDPKRFTAAGCAEYHPAASMDTPEGRQKNRRVEIFLKNIEPADVSKK